MFLIYTKDAFLLEKQTKKLIDKLTKKESDVEINFYSWIEDDANKILEDAMTFGLLSDEKILVIKDSYFLTEKKPESNWKNNNSDIALKLLNLKNEDLNIIFTLNEEKISKKLKVAKEFNEKCEVISVPELDEKQIVNFIVKKLESKNKIISEEAAIYLANSLPIDMQIISNEVNKLSNLDIENIDQNIIDQNITKYSEVDAFKLTEYFINNNEKEFIKAFRNYLDLNQELIGLIYLLSSNLSFTRDAFILKKQGKSEASIAELLNAHPYRVKMAFKTYNNVDIKSLNDKILLLYKLNGSLIRGEIKPEIISELELLKVMKRG